MTSVADIVRMNARKRTTPDDHVLESLYDQMKIILLNDSAEYGSKRVFFPLNNDETFSEATLEKLHMTRFKTFKVDADATKKLNEMAKLDGLAFWRSKNMTMHNGGSEWVDCHLGLPSEKDCGFLGHLLPENVY